MKDTVLKAPAPVIFWCIGLYASGSTWIFNAGKKIAAAAGLNAGLASCFATNQAELVFPPGTRTAIVKTHELPETTIDFLAAQSRAIWLSLRDPRDCIASLMIYQDCAFDEALEMTEDAARAGLSIMDRPHTILFRFEDDFFDAPATLDAIANSLGCCIGTDDRARIFAETRRSAVEAFIDTFPDIPSVVTQPEPGHLVDTDSQWHTHHSGRTGEVGRWRKVLTIGQIEIVNKRLSETMRKFGYECSS